MIVDNISYEQGRRWEYQKLKPSKAKYQAFYFWDIETTQWGDNGLKHIDFERAYRIYASMNPKGKITKQVDKAFIDNIDLINDLESMAITQHRLTCIAHNTGFDLRYSGMLEELGKREWEIKVFYSTQSTTFIRLEKDKKNITFIDSMNWYPFKLETLGKVLKCPKLSMPLQLASSEQWTAYNRQDCVIMMKAISQLKAFFYDNWGKNLAYTRGSDALQIAKLPKYGLKAYRHCNINATKAEFYAYFGGRTECFKLGKLPDETWYKLDVNSLYPFIMQNQLFSGNLETQNASDLADIRSGIDNGYNYLCNISGKIDDPYCPVRHEKGLYFPIGKIKGWFCGDELKYILDHADNLTVNKAYQYKAEVDFEPLIQYLYDLRLKYKQAEDEINQINVKLIMNSIYGKYAQRNTQLQYLYKVPDDLNTMGLYTDEKTGNIETCRVFQGRFYKEIRDKLSNSACPIIPAEITSSARLYMYKLLIQAGIENVAYMDTDSLFVNKNGYRALRNRIDPKRLGFLKLEGKSDKVVLAGSKAYSFNEEIYLKGVPRKAVKNLNGSYRYLQVGSLNEVFNGQAGKRDDVRIVDKILDFDYWKSNLSLTREYSPIYTDMW